MSTHQRTKQSELDSMMKQVLQGYKEQKFTHTIHEDSPMINENFPTKHEGEVRFGTIGKLHNSAIPILLMTNFILSC